MNTAYKELNDKKLNELKELIHSNNNFNLSKFVVALMQKDDLIRFFTKHAKKFSDTDIKTVNDILGIDLKVSNPDDRVINADKVIHNGNKYSLVCKCGQPDYNDNLFFLKNKIKSTRIGLVQVSDVFCTGCGNTFICELRPICDNCKRVDTIGTILTDLGVNCRKCYD